ncbi:MAG TPA: peptidylprolyl isomerase [Candidatus Cloacimonadota bacterium]|nr:peptidylprolyl isomerase [Candidatus Cloacimonadota bacterium]
MLIIAKVADIEILEADIIHEERELCPISDVPKPHRTSILARLIDSCLLYFEAISQGIEADQQEYDEELMYSLEGMVDSGGWSPPSEEETKAMEARVSRRVVIRKYIHEMQRDAHSLSDEQLRAFYEDQKELFTSPEEVRVSHILIRKHRENAEAKAHEVRSNIHTEDDFNCATASCSDCPSNLSCGDLGFFPRGKMHPAIEEMAFSLEVGEISDVFTSPFGYHILMVTDKKAPAQLPFEEIKEALKIRLMSLEREFYLAKHVRDLREKYKNLIQILAEEYK